MPHDAPGLATNPPVTRTQLSNSAGRRSTRRIALLWTRCGSEFVRPRDDFALHDLDGPDPVDVDHPPEDRRCPCPRATAIRRPTRRPWNRQARRRKGRRALVDGGVVAASSDAEPLEQPELAWDLRRRADVAGTAYFAANGRVRRSPLPAMRTRLADRWPHGATVCNDGPRVRLVVLTPAVSGRGVTSWRASTPPAPSPRFAAPGSRSPA